MTFIAQIAHLHDFILIMYTSRGVENVLYPNE